MKPWFVSVILFFVAQSAFSAPVDQQSCWNEASLNTATRMNDNPATFSDPYAASIWGVLKADRQDLSDDDLRYSTAYLRTSLYGKKIPSYLITQKQGTSPFTRNAPLLVILPGIFGASRDANEVAKAQNFYRQGYHVLVLPNPWSVEAIEHQPAQMPGTIEAEGRAVLEMVQTAVQKEIGYKHVSSISLYGESYGALLAGIATGLDDANDPLITGKLMLASPPLKIMNAYQKLDLIYKESAPLQAGCKKNILELGWNYFRAKGQWDLKSDSLECAEALVANSFLDSLGNSLKALQKTDLDFPRDEPYEVSFNYYADHLAPETIAYCKPGSDNHCELKYWLSQAVNHGKKNIDIVSSRDDFLNSPADWDDIRKILPDADHQLILLNWGGHLGYNGYSEYTSTLYQN